MRLFSTLFDRRPKKAYWVTLQRDNGDFFAGVVYERSKEAAEEKALDDRLPTGVRHRDAGYCLVASDRMRHMDRK